MNGYKFGKYLIIDQKLILFDSMAYISIQIKIFRVLFFAIVMINALRFQIKNTFS